MAAIKLIVSSPLSSLSLPCKFRTGGDCTKLQPWSTVPSRAIRPTNDKRLVAAAGFHQISAFLQEPAAAAASDIVNNFDLQTHPSSLFSLATAAAESTGYSLASYYTSLGLFVISVPGLWSLIKRSVKSKIVKKSFVGGGEGEEGTTKMKEPKQMAGEILSFFTRNNFVVTDRGETITFEGEMVPSRGQAALLTFCTCISLGSVALVLTITVPDVGDKWYYLTILSPLAGIYYWKKASRKEQIKVKMIVSEEGTLSEIVVQGDDQQVEQMRKELQLSEKGMVYVKGIFER